MEREYWIAFGVTMTFFAGYVVGADRTKKKYRKQVEKQFKLLGNAYTSVLVDTYTNNLDGDAVLKRLQEELAFMKIVTK